MPFPGEVEKILHQNTKAQAILLESGFGRLDYSFQKALAQSKKPIRDSVVSSISELVK